MDRRSFLRHGVAAGGGYVYAPLLLTAESPTPDQRRRDFASSTEVIGDGKWVWTKPPKDKKGLLEPRAFEFKAHITIQGKGRATGISSSTAVPVQLPEQKIDDAQIQTRGCRARLRQLTPAAGQMILAAGGIDRGQVIAATAAFRLTLYKQFFDYKKDQFPQEQTFEIATRRDFMSATPGIYIKSPQVRELADKVGGQFSHPWEKAHAFKKWVWANIKSEAALRYRGVLRAIQDGKGDCEERAAVFTALCRISGIPARIVWVPNHVWAEFGLKDHQGKGHWIPAHTSGFTWFGLTGAHELVLQKGEGVPIPEKRKKVRFIHDTATWTGVTPKITYTAQLTPLPTQPGDDPGPGGRIKPGKGPWRPANHKLDKYLLSGELSDKSPFKKNKPEVAPWE